MAETEKKILFIGPVVWGGVWGHGPELASMLAGDYRLCYLDPIIPAGALKPSFRDSGNYGIPENIAVIRRESRLGAGLIYGISMELRNLFAAVRLRPTHLITYYPLGCILALVWGKLTGIKSLFVYADFPDIFRNRVFAWMARNLGTRFTAGLATCGTVATSRMLLKDIAKHSSKCYHVPNGVRLDKTETLAARGTDVGGGLTICFVGYFGEWLDIEEIARAARARKGDRFLIVGDGPEMEKLKNIEAGLPNIILTGSVGHEKVFELIAGADLCIIPFRVNRITDRVCPVKLFEYWSCGKPVVASNTAELRHIAADSGDALLLYESEGRLAEIISGFADNRRFLDAAGKAAREKVKEYDWRLLAEKIKAILDSRVSEKTK